MGIECQILLNPPYGGVYRNGQCVTGTFWYSLDKPTFFESIVVRLKGKGKCAWLDNDSDSTARQSKENYVASHINILNNTEEKIGNYNRPFEFILPDNIPSSYKNKFCTISYKIIVEFNVPGFLNSKKKFFGDLPVRAYLESGYDEPKSLRVTKTPFSLTSSKTTLGMNIKIEKTFVTPGEAIHFNVMIRNHTDVAITGIKANLIEETTYMSVNPIKTVMEKTVDGCEKKLPAIREKSVVTLSDIMPTLTNLCSIQCSSIFKNQYKLKVTAKLPFPHKNLSAELPVVIGERHGYL